MLGGKKSSASRVERFRSAERRLLESYALEPHERRFDLTGSRVNARVLSVGEGEPVLYVHGGGAFGTVWAPLVARLEGYWHLMADRPGFGLSSRTHLKRGESLREHAVRFLSELLTANGIGAANVVGNSMGGLWALWLALDSPERVRRLALLGAPALTAGGSGPLALRLLGRPVIGYLKMALAPPSRRRVQEVFEFQGSNLRAVNDALLETWLAAEQRPDFGPAWRSLLFDAFTLRGPRPKCEVRATELNKLKASTRLVWGSRDPFGDHAMAERIRDAIPNASLSVVDAGHQPWVDAAESCAAVVAEHLQDGAISER